MSAVRPDRDWFDRAAVRYPMEGRQEPDGEAAAEAILLAEQVATFILDRSAI